MAVGRLFSSRHLATHPSRQIEEFDFYFDFFPPNQRDMAGSSVEILPYESELVQECAYKFCTDSSVQVDPLLSPEIQTSRLW